MQIASKKKNEKKGMILNIAKYKREKRNPQSHRISGQKESISSIKKTNSQSCTGVGWSEESEEN